MEGMATSIAGINKFRYEEEKSRKNEMMGPTSNGPTSSEDDLQESGQRPGSLGSMGVADSMGGPDDLSPTVTQVNGPFKIADNHLLGVFLTLFLNKVSLKRDYCNIVRSK